jgi:hypothetical protein
VENEGESAFEHVLLYKPSKLALSQALAKETKMISQVKSANSLSIFSPHETSFRLNIKRLDPLVFDSPAQYCHWRP